MVRVLGLLACLILILSACKTVVPATMQTESVDTTVFVEEFIYPVNEVKQTLQRFYSEDNLSSPFDSIAQKSTSGLYQTNGFGPIWNSDTLIQQAIELIKSANNHGLASTDYLLPEIDSLNSIRKIDSFEIAERHALLDIYLSYGILKYSKHLYFGKLKPLNYHDSWNYPKQAGINFDSILLQKAKNLKAIEIEHYFEPKTQAYFQLKKELLKYKSDSSTVLNYSINYPEMLNRLGDSNQYVRELKVCLAQKGMYPNSSINAKFDTLLFQSLVNLQNKHGLTPDGLPGKKTYDVLNWNHQRYYETIKLNLERLRWLPRKLPANYIQANIPEYQLNVYTEHKLYYSTRIIVGKYDNQTPVITSDINYLVFNPCWTVPNSIASEKMLPRIQRDSTYLDKRNMFITRNGVRQNHHEIDFSEYNKSNFPFKVFQNTDPGNALGKVKFMFPNNHTIYLHDTPGKSLFNRDHRAFSHGCVRVQNAEHLAKLIVKDIDGNPKDLDYFYSKGFPVKVYLDSPIPLYITYHTCSYNPELNMVQFFRDVYGFDYRLLKNL